MSRCVGAGAVGTCPPTGGARHFWPRLTKFHWPGSDKAVFANDFLSSPLRAAPHRTGRIASPWGMALRTLVLLLFVSVQLVPQSTPGLSAAAELSRPPGSLCRWPDIVLSQLRLQLRGGGARGAPRGRGRGANALQGVRTNRKRAISPHAELFEEETAPADEQVGSVESSAVAAAIHSDTVLACSSGPADLLASDEQAPSPHATTQRRSDDGANGIELAGKGELIDEGAGEWRGQTEEEMERLEQKRAQWEVRARAPTEPLRATLAAGPPRP